MEGEREKKIGESGREKIIEKGKGKGDGRKGEGEIERGKEMEGEEGEEK